MDFLGRARRSRDGRVESYACRRRRWRGGPPPSPPGQTLPGHQVSRAAITLSQCLLVLINKKDTLLEIQSFCSFFLGALKYFSIVRLEFPKKKKKKKKKKKTINVCARWAGISTTGGRRKKG